MNAKDFWSVIELYNQNTLIIQAVLLVMVVIAVALSYTNKVTYAAKVMLGIANLFLAGVFFGYYGTQPFQKFFALPLYLICGVLFLYEAWHNKEDVLEKPNVFQMILLLLYALYPAVSFLLGNHYPRMVTHVMPCPIITLSIIVYAGYKEKNKLLLLFLTIWGLTGVKSAVFSVYEDLILLVCGIYGIYLLVNEIRAKKAYA